jgi:hypothetical protein
MRRTLSTALLLGFAIPAFSISALAQSTSGQQSDAKTADTAPHMTPQSPEARPHGTAPSAVNHKKRKRKKKPASTSQATQQQTPHMTPQSPEAAPPAPHTTPQ